MSYSRAPYVVDEIEKYFDVRYSTRLQPTTTTPNNLSKLAVMHAAWADGSGADGLKDGYTEEGDTVSYTFTVRPSALASLLTRHFSLVSRIYVDSFIV